MSESLLTGTVRAREGHRFVVVTPNGEQVRVLLEGVDTPRIGVDIIGFVSGKDDDLRMRLVPDVTRSLLDGRARIIPSGRPEITARMLARLLAGAGPAAIRVGVGGMIDRTTTVDDPDISWALSIIEPEARRSGVALNVIDPMGLVDSPWDDALLKEEILPADTSGEERSLSDLKRLLNSGMAPACSRTILRIGRGLEVPSVDFVLPYSPLATGQSWSAEIAGAWSNEFVVMAVDQDDARKLSAFREMALAFAPRYLGRNKGPTAHHVEQAFADVSAAIALMNFGGSSLTVLRFQRLREAALARAEADGRDPPATAEALASILSSAAQNMPETAEDIFELAASIAKTHAPRTAKDLKAQQDRAKADDIFIDLDKASPSTVRELKASYAKDLGRTVERLHGSPRAMARMAAFGIFQIPSGFEQVFDDVLGPVEMTETIDLGEQAPLSMAI